MSNLDCMMAMVKWNVNKNCKIILCHKSGDHANYDTTYKLFDSMGIPYYIAKAGDELFCKKTKWWEPA
ncbi:MAG: hypothetical protein HUJ52_04200 [Malacoplasma sp.]|nr:hypothetical protein [Malacoplasma sp.]